MHRPLVYYASPPPHGNEARGRTLFLLDGPDVLLGVCFDSWLQEDWKTIAGATGCSPHHDRGWLLCPEGRTDPLWRAPNTSWFCLQKLWKVYLRRHSTKLGALSYSNWLRMLKSCWSVFSFVVAEARCIFWTRYEVICLEVNPSWWSSSCSCQPCWSLPHAPLHSRPDSRLHGLDDPGGIRSTFDGFRHLPIKSFWRIPVDFESFAGLHSFWCGHPCLELLRNNRTIVRLFELFLCVWFS